MTRVVERGEKKQKPSTDAQPRKPVRTEDNVGSALRAAYQTAVDESVPQEMLDLLGKLR